MAMNLAERGRAAWPELAIDPGEFMTWLGARASEPDLHVEELWLCCACLKQVPGAIEALGRHALDVALRGVPSNEREDVRQRVLTRLLVGPKPKLAEYQGRGSLTRWLTMVAVREAKPERKRAGEHTPLEDEAERLSAVIISGADTKLHRAQAAATFKSALSAGIAKLDEAERALLRGHHLEGRSHEALGQQLGIPRSTVAHRLAKVRQRILEVARQHLVDEGLGDEEIQSLFALSRVDLTFSKL